MTTNKGHRDAPAVQSIRRAVAAQPGIHFRGLGRAAHVSSAGQLRHHLDRLERQGVVVEIQDGRYKRFFVAGEQDPKLRPEIARFSRVVPRRIAKLLLASPMNRTQLRRSLGCADSTLGYHLARMVLLGDLAKTRGVNCCNYSLTREELVRRMLAMDASSGVTNLPAEPDPMRPVPPRPPNPYPVPPLDRDHTLPPLGEALQRSPTDAPTTPQSGPPSDAPGQDSPTA